MNEQQEDQRVVFTRGLFVRGLLPVLLLALVAVIEFTTCLDQVKAMRSTRQGQELYRSAWVANVINLGIFGPITYYVSVLFACTPNKQNWVALGQTSFGILFIEGLCYYFIHKAFHEFKCLYWMHRYHHNFNTIVLPSTANAVSIWEFIIAYMVPLFLANYMTKASDLSGVLACGTIGITNVLIHTSWMESTEYHWIFVSAHDHMEHHRRLKGNYGAPVFHMDRLFQEWQTGWTFMTRPQHEQVEVRYNPKKV